MLVITRKVDEAIVIGANIRVVVVDIDGGRVRLGIQAPRDTPIWREELLPVRESAPPEVREPWTPFPLGVSDDNNEDQS